MTLYKSLNIVGPQVFSSEKLRENGKIEFDQRALKYVLTQNISNTLSESGKAS